MNIYNTVFLSDIPQARCLRTGDGHRLFAGACRRRPYTRTLPYRT